MNVFSRYNRYIVTRIEYQQVTCIKIVTSLKSCYMGKKKECPDIRHSNTNY